MQFYKFLQKIGLEVKKSLTLKALAIPKNYFSDFLRGVIDGDGNISMWSHNSNKNIQWSLRIFSASSAFSIWLKNNIENSYNVKGKLYKYKKLNTNCLYTIKFGKLAAKEILSKCYYDRCLALSRKNLKALKCLQTKNGLSKYGNVVPVV